MTPKENALQEINALLLASGWVVQMKTGVNCSAQYGLLQRIAENAKSGVCQYFTPRPLIAPMVDVAALQAGQAICDPACAIPAK